MAAFHEDTLYPLLATYVRENRHGFDGIAAERRTRLEEIALYVGKRIEANELSRLTFICTHNSRRSQLAQVWAQTAAHHYGVCGVSTFSGGTQATCVEPRALQALQAAGFAVSKALGDGNPHYLVRYAQRQPPIELWSKVFDHTDNPRSDFLAVLTCSEADTRCPIVAGAAERLALPYQDPKAADRSAQEADAYRACCRLIAREMFYLFNQV